MSTDFRDFWLQRASRAAASGGLRGDDLESLIRHPRKRVRELLPGAEYLRENFFENRISLCSILNARSGACSEDCAFCAQSRRSRADIEEYPLVPWQNMIEAGRACISAGVDRYSIVTSGRGMGRGEVRKILPVLESLSPEIGMCASLGMVGGNDLERMKEAGLTRYHHNLEAAPEVFANICTTHSFEKRVETVRAAKKAGLSVCSGGVFGIGETDRHVADLGVLLRDLDVDAVPVNFLVPVPGTPLGDISPPSALRCLKVIAMLRFILPDKEIIVCGGRMENLGELHPLIFQAGASRVMTGNYLTVRGRTTSQDISLIRSLGLNCT